MARPRGAGIPPVYAFERPVAAERSTHEHTAIHRDSCPGNVSSRLTGKKRYHCGDLFGLTETPQRNLFEHDRTLVIVQRTGHVRIDESRCHRVHGDPT